MNRKQQRRVQQYLATLKRRARNKVARRSRRINRLAAR
jgi:hypothetical protein